MSPASVNGVAEMVYTPFADESSSWVMMLMSARSVAFSVCREWHRNKCIPRASRAATDAPFPQSEPGTRGSLLPMHKPCLEPCLVPVLHYTLPLPERGKLHDPISVFDYLCRTASRHVC